MVRAAHWHRARIRLAKVSSPAVAAGLGRVSRVLLDASCSRGGVMSDPSDFRTKILALSHGSGQMPVLGFGILIPDAAGT